MHTKQRSLFSQAIEPPYQAATLGETQRRLRSFAGLVRVGAMHPEDFLLFVVEVLG